MKVYNWKKGAVGMIDWIVPIVLGLGSLLLLFLVIYKVLIQKKKVSSMYVPYDDMTRGTTDINGRITPPVDTRHIIPQEESEKVD